jgi:hypothetical protein
LLYSTYLGGSDSESLITGLAIDQSGHVYIAGATSSADFPVTAGAPDTSNDNGFIDGFVTKLSDTGRSLVYSTYLGGMADEVANDVAVDPAGNAYVVGQTASADFPTTSGVLDTTFSGSYEDGFVTKVDATGTSFDYSTFLGGTGPDSLKSVAVDSSGRAYVTGRADFPTTPGSFRPDVQDAMVIKLNSAGTSPLYSTYLGSTGGGGGTDPVAIELDAPGSAYVTGSTGQQIAVTPGAVDSTLGGGSDAFLLKLTPAADEMAYGTYLGGGDTDWAQGLAGDSQGNAVIAGASLSTDFPTTAGAPQGVLAGSTDAFITKIKPQFTYTQPVGGSPFRSSFVPAFTPCPSPTANASHDAPLSGASCNPPAPASSVVAVGSRSLGFARLVVLGNGECAPFDSSRCYPDVTLRASVSDVRQGSPTGSDYDTPSGQDLTLQGNGLRITDLNNKTGSGTNFDEAATAVPLDFPVPVSCTPTADTTIGSACNAQTTANALAPGAAVAGKRAVWELGQLQILDQGPNGVPGDSDDRPFEIQGVFVP